MPFTRKKARIDDVATRVAGKLGFILKGKQREVITDFPTTEEVNEGDLLIK